MEGMNEDLRDRIAAALYRQFPPYQLGYTFGCPTERWEDESEQCKDVYRRDADAVIAALQIEVEDGECNYCHAMLPGCRYSTWKADE